MFYFFYHIFCLTLWRVPGKFQIYRVPYIFFEIFYISLPYPSYEKKFCNGLGWTCHKFSWKNKLWHKAHYNLHVILLFLFHYVVGLVNGTVKSKKTIFLLKHKSTLNSLFWQTSHIKCVDFFYFCDGWLKTESLGSFKYIGYLIFFF
jgi:hypothetical protein